MYHYGVSLNACLYSVEFFKNTFQNNLSVLPLSIIPNSLDPDQVQWLVEFDIDRNILQWFNQKSPLAGLSLEVSC